MRTSKILRVVSALAILLAAGSLLGHAAGSEVSHDGSNPVVLTVSQTLDFQLVGSRAGAFAYYKIDYPGDGRVVSFELDSAPGDPGVMGAVGLNVYGPNGYLIGSARTSRTICDRKVFMWSDHTPLSWLVQVYNYVDGVPVSFHMILGGLPPVDPTPTPAPVMQPSEAKPLSIGSGSLLGHRAGKYAFYKLELQLGQTMGLHLFCTPDNQYVTQGFGVNVWGPDGVQYVTNGSHDVRFVAGPFGEYLVQVYNYLHAINVTYVLTHD